MPGDRPAKLLDGAYAPPGFAIASIESGLATGSAKNPVNVCPVRTSNPIQYEPAISCQTSPFAPYHPGIALPTLSNYTIGAVAGAEKSSLPGVETPSEYSATVNVPGWPALDR